MKRLLKKNIVFIVICIVSLFFSLMQVPELKEDKVFSSDVLEYYMYFPTYFIYCAGDYNVKSRTDTVQHDWAKVSPTGRLVLKFTMGVSVLASPFYMLAHSWCMLDDYDANGFENPYAVAMLFATVFYLLIGLFFVREILLLNFKPLVADIVILLLFGATNLAYYSFFLVGMSHTFSLAIISMYIYYTIRWHKSQATRYLIFVGILVGFIFLIRPVNILFAAFFILIGCKSFKDIYTKVVSLLKNRRFYLLPVSALAIAFPQFLYWKVQTGSWFFYSYFNEGFFFRDPKIVEVFLSFRSGLLIYAPVLLFAVIGLFLLKKRLNDYMFVVLGTFIVFTYIISSWWCWWYVGFGHRAFIDLFPLLAIPFAISIEKVLGWKWWHKGPVAAITAFFVYLSVFQTLQYSRGRLHFDGMTMESYFKSFLNMHPGVDFYESLHSPNYHQANQGFRECLNYDEYFDFEVKNTNRFEIDGNWTYCAPRFYGLAYKGEYSQYLDSVNSFSVSYCEEIGEMFNEMPDSIALYTWYYAKEDSNTAMFVFNILDEDSIIDYETFPVVPKNPLKEKWQYSRVVVPWPDAAKKEQTLKMYIWNPHKGKIYVDDFGFSLYF